MAKPKVLGPQYPVSIEREYYRYLNKYAEFYNKEIREGLADMVPDLKEVASKEQPRLDENIEDKISKLFKMVDNKLAIKFPDQALRKIIRAMVGRSSRFSKEQIMKMLKSVPKSYGKDDVNIEPLLIDSGLNPYFQNIIDENVGLIKSIPKMHQVAFKNQLVFMITKDARSSEIAKAIQDHIGKKGNVKNRAKLIAVDQVGKLNGALEEHRQQQLGMKRYKWRNAGDQKVAGNPSGLYPNAKPSHWAREGKIYYWSKPPQGGHPKQRPRCRCWAEPIFEDII